MSVKKKGRIKADERDKKKKKIRFNQILQKKIWVQNVEILKEKC